MELSRAGLGVGFYSRAEARRLLRVPHETLRRWVMGYTFKERSGRSEHQTALIPPSLPRLDGQVALSFVDLIVPRHRRWIHKLVREPEFRLPVQLRVRPNPLSGSNC